MLKLMIVDDEAILVNGLQHMVRRANTPFTDIVGLSDSVEALRAMETFRPDLLMTDIQMPEMSGLELIEAAQRKMVSRFVILTGYDRFEYARAAVRLKVADYLLKPVDPKELAALLHKLSAEIAAERELPRAAVTEAVPAEEDGNDNIRKFKAFIQDNFMQDISLEEVAAHLGLHPNYVCALLKRETGMTFIQYLRSVRIERAKSLLGSLPNLPMDQISKHTGFENTRHFYKVFKRHIGLTPGEYRSSVLEAKRPRSQ